MITLIAFVALFHVGDKVKVINGEEKDCVGYVYKETEKEVLIKDLKCYYSNGVISYLTVTYEKKEDVRLDK